MNFDELLRKLKNKGLSTNALEAADPAKQKHLLDQFNSGEKQLVIMDGKALSAMQSVVVIITWPLTRSLDQKLVEFERRPLKAGKVIRRSDLDGIGKKMRWKEDKFKAAERCLKEKLDFHFSIGFICCGYDDRLSPDTSPLPSGLVVNRRHFIRCELPADLYDPAGYEKTFRNHTAIFRWVPQPKTNLFSHFVTN